MTAKKITPSCAAKRAHRSNCRAKARLRRLFHCSLLLSAIRDFGENPRYIIIVGSGQHHGFLLHNPVAYSVYRTRGRICVWSSAMVRVPGKVPSSPIRWIFRCSELSLLRRPFYSGTPWRKKGLPPGPFTDTRIAQKGGPPPKQISFPWWGD